MIRNAVKVDAARSQVFQALTDFARYSQWVPGCESCHIIKVSGNVVDVEMTFNSLRRMKVGLRFESDPVQLIRFELTKSSDIKAYSGTYRLMDSADHQGTVVMAELEINGGLLAPRFLVDNIARRTALDTGEALKSWVRKMQPATQLGPVASPARAPRKRDKRLVRVIATPTGYEVQLFGRSFSVGNE